MQNLTGTDGARQPRSRWPLWRTLRLAVILVGSAVLVAILVLPRSGKAVPASGTGSPGPTFNVPAALNAQVDEAGLMRSGGIRDRADIGFHLRVVSRAQSAAARRPVARRPQAPRPAARRPAARRPPAPRPPAPRPPASRSSSIEPAMAAAHGSRRRSRAVSGAIRRPCRSSMPTTAS